MSYIVFEYMYCDAANYKVHGCVWLGNDMPEIDMAAFKAFLDQSEFFIAEQVGVPALQFGAAGLGDLDEDDHVWHAFVGFRREACIPPNCISAGPCSQFLRKFQTAAGQWRIENSLAYSRAW